MTEKPMATRWADGLAMVKACDEAGVRLFVVKQNRRNRTLQLLRQAIGQGRFGRVYMVTVNVFWSGHRATTTPPHGAAPGSSTAAPS
jgi:UDP-N-acetyl-2-amino-2-deoxyglucuronate dehydrogenase